jgi:DNA recombination protein RmuC
MLFLPKYLIFMTIIAIIFALLFVVAMLYIVSVQSKIASSTKSLEDKNTQLILEKEEWKNKYENQVAKVEELIGNLSSEKTKNENLLTRLTEQKTEIENLNNKLKIEFENIANKILEEKSEKFTKQNSEKLDEILKPFKFEIKEFKDKVESSHKESIDRDAALRQQLSNLKELNVQMSQDAKNLVLALKGDSKTQGNWGEVILERILEKSGLQKDREYVIQESVTDDFSGRRLQPDVVIYLPDEKRLVIDSKVSLVAYEKYSSEEDEKMKEIYLKDHIASLKKHIKDLHEKEYHKLYDMRSPDFVLLFMPIEPAFNLAVQNNPNIYNEAFEKNIVIVSTSTLLATLFTIASIWKQENQNRNVIEIANLGGRLYDKFTSLLDDLVDVGRRIKSSNTSYEEAMKKLSTGKGNVIGLSEKLKNLGAKATKQIPANLLDRATGDVNDDEDED